MRASSICSDAVRFLSSSAEDEDTEEDAVESAAVSLFSDSEAVSGAAACSTSAAVSVFSLSDGAALSSAACSVPFRPISSVLVVSFCSTLDTVVSPAFSEAEASVSPLVVPSAVVSCTGVSSAARSLTLDVIPLAATMDMERNSAIHFRNVFFFFIVLSPPTKYRQCFRDFLLRTSRTIKNAHTARAARPMTRITRCLVEFLSLSEFSLILLSGVWISSA